MGAKSLAKAKQDHTTEEEEEPDSWIDEQVELSRPTVIFLWEFQDLQRLMNADPRVYSALSLMLGVDLSDKRRNAADDSLGSIWCGMHTYAHIDDGTSDGFCGTRPELTHFESVDVNVL